MRIVIGIIFGLLIIFNWGSIKTYFDSKIAENQPTKSDAQPQAISPPLQSKANNSQDSNSDSFKSFK